MKIPGFFTKLRLVFLVMFFDFPNCIFKLPLYNVGNKIGRRFCGSTEFR